MRGTIAVTDFGWYEFLRERSAAQPLAEVNFWSPSSRRAFRAPEFSPFLFKLKAPHNAIVGFGYFARWARLPDWLAWECFGSGNGCGSLAELRQRLADIRARIGFKGKPDADIGCILLVEPTFFPRELWIPQPADWPARTLSSKGYDLASGEGARVWQACLARAAQPPVGLATPDAAGRYGRPQQILPRLGQGTFRIAVTDAYDRACAVTGEHSLPALEAAHIRSYAEAGPHEVPNGLLLRADLHRLFDRGYVTVTPDLRLEVSGRLREDYHNGRSYYPLHGASLTVPRLPMERPAAEYLQWHNEHVYRG